MFVWYLTFLTVLSLESGDAVTAVIAEAVQTHALVLTWIYFSAFVDVYKRKCQRHMGKMFHGVWDIIGTIWAGFADYEDICQSKISVWRLLPSSQCCPSVPAPHSQWKLPRLFRHTPSFWHGSSSGRHSMMSVNVHADCLIKNTSGYINSIWWQD